MTSAAPAEPGRPPEEPDPIETWMAWLRDQLATTAPALGRGAAPGIAARVFYADKLAGSVLVLAIEERDVNKLVEVVVTGRARGHAHVAVLATTHAGASTAAAAITGRHGGVPRTANAKRKLVHRMERLLATLVEEWSNRSAGFPTAELAVLRDLFPAAVPMIGVGYHVDMAAEPDHHTRERYPSVYAAAIQLGGAWRGLPWDPAARKFALGGALLAALAGDSSLAVRMQEPRFANVLAVEVVVAAVAPASTEVRSSAPWYAGCDVGSCVPDCDVMDLGDCGGLDCSL